MLSFLDAGVNVKGSPNENFAREIMELFTMGVGEYEEADIREAMSRDKKARQSRVRCVFLARIGEVARDPDGHVSFGLSDPDLGEPLTTALRPAE